jgi:hypothetical protein
MLHRQHMGTTTELRRALKTLFIPYAVDRGFVVDERGQPRSTVFRRRVRSRVEMFEVQWEKYGTPRFAVHFGTCRPRDFVSMARFTRPKRLSRRGAQTLAASNHAAVPAAGRGSVRTPG